MPPRAGRAQPPSLGDETFGGYVRARFSVPFPGGRTEVIRTISEILGQGGVQKITVEVGQPVVYEKLVKDDGTLEDVQAVDAEDLFGAVRNSEIVDFQFRGESSYETLFNAFAHVSQRKLAPKAFLIHRWTQLRNWLGADVEEKPIELFGLEGHVHEEVPEDVLLLVAASKVEPDVVELSLRIPM